MNKVIDTSTRLFLAIVGPSGSGKTELIFKLLKGKTFYPKFQRALYFYKEIQPLYSEKSNTHIIDLTFIKFNGFDSLRNLENILLVFDDSCEEIYNDKDFVILATAGRHRGLDVIYVKHNLFQQSRWSRTIDLNTSHIILFKSPRDIQQLDHLGRQLNNTKFLRHCYQLATKDTYGHLLIDLDPRTSDCLRYCSNITPPGPSIFYLPINQAEVTPLTNEREKIIYSAAHGTIESQPAPNFSLISVICECLLNVVNGNVSVNIPNIENFQVAYKLLISRKTKLERKRAIILTKQGFNLIRLILYFWYRYLPSA